MIRKLIGTVLFCSFTLAGGDLAVASGSGASVLFPYFKVFFNSTTQHAATTHVFVTNVSGHDVQVSVRFIDFAGNGPGSTGFSAARTVAGGLTQCDSSFTTCVLPAGKGGQFTIYHSNVDVIAQGHGTIEWVPVGSGNPAVALIASGQLASYVGNTTSYTTLFSYERPF